MGDIGLCFYLLATFLPYQVKASREKVFVTFKVNDGVNRVDGKFFLPHLRMAINRNSIFWGYRKNRLGKSQFEILMIEKRRFKILKYSKVHNYDQTKSGVKQAARKMHLHFFPDLEGQI
jgi:hypothetical protein